MGVRRLHRKGDPYPVLLENRLLDSVGQRVRRLWPKHRIAVVTQSRLRTLHGDRLAASLVRAGIDTTWLTMPEGEQRKSLDTARSLYGGLLRNGFGREDALVAFGGGVVGDTAGFVAATFMRGVPYAQIPTTLLAQIDSALGAKVAVNLPEGKNLVGAMYRPRAVWMDPTLLASLPARDFRAGLFELLKYGFIGAPALLRLMETTTVEPGGARLIDAIAAGARRKLDVVREDELEVGSRRILNFGHTIGHGLEAASDYKLLRHGEAVGWGMIGAVRLGHRHARLSASVAARLEKVIRGVGPLPSVRGINRKRVMTAVGKDKKLGKSGLRFVLPTGVGTVEITTGFPPSEISWVLAELGIGARKTPLSSRGRNSGLRAG